jgi:hypothetical protein
VTPDPGSLFTPRPQGDPAEADDPATTGRAWRGILPATDNPTGWRLVGVWALGSLVVAATGLTVAVLLGSGPPGVAQGIERVVVFPLGGGRHANDPAPPAAPVPGEAGPTARIGAGVPDRLPSTGQPTDPTDSADPAYPGYPLAPGVPLPPGPAPGGADAALGQQPPPAATSLPVPTEPTTPGTSTRPTTAATPTATAQPTDLTGEPTQSPSPTEPTQPAETTGPAETSAPPTEPPTEPTADPPTEETPDEPPADPPEPESPAPGTP